MNHIEMLREALALAERQVEAATRNTQAATPCSEWNAGQLVSHMIATIDGNTALIKGTAPTVDPFNPPTLEADALLRNFQRAAKALIEAASEPGVLNTMLAHPASPDPMPVSAALMFPTFDNYVHSWDLAQATGLETDYPTELHAAVNGWCQIVFAGERTPGIVEDAVAPPTPASPIESLAAFLGRKAGV